MSTKHSLVILAPNGRRQTVNVTQNTSIQEVLETVCKKQDLDFNEWDLKHYNRIIELANSVRFSGLPNNASLEMVQTTKPRKETTITLVLQLESGKRLKQEFSSAANLWDILTHWQNNGEEISLPSDSGDLVSADASSDDIQPVCIYMRQEILGEEQLQKTTLRSLGLTHGAACIRLIHRSQTQLKHQANISAPIVSRPTPSAGGLKEDKLGDEKPSNASQSLTSSHVENSKRTRSPSPSPQPRPPEPAQEKHESMEVDSVESDSATVTQSDDESGRPGGAHSEPEYVRPENKLAPDGQLNILGEHDACFYYSGDVNRLNWQSDYDESFYEITKQDVQRRQRDLQRMREQLENAPLQTAEARELQREEFQRKILAEHPSTVIRVRFPNRYILQGIFRTDDTIGSVAALVRKYLSDQNLNFYLLITPPRTILSNETRLIDQNLIGSAVIYFGCDLAGETVDFLCPTLYERLSDPNAIRDFVQRNIRLETRSGTDLPSAASAQNIAQQGSSNQSHAADSSRSREAHTPSSSAPASHRTPRAAASAQNSEIVPKWFKK